MRQFVLFALLLGTVVQPFAQVSPKNPLSIYVIDVEGGNATLFVSPTGESLLIDTGNGGAAGARDALRILDAARDAAVRQIDHLVLTHYHADHFGGLSELATRISIKHFIDHGTNVEVTAATDAFLPAYEALYVQSRRTIAARGYHVPISGLDVQVIMSAGRALNTPLPGAGRANPYCAAYAPKAADATENAQSVGTSIRLGRFQALFLGDLARLIGSRYPRARTARLR